MSIWVGSVILKGSFPFNSPTLFNINSVKCFFQKVQGRRDTINLDTGESTLKMQFYYLKTGDVIIAVM